MENAMTIARTHLREMNPSSWDGTGFASVCFHIDQSSFFNKIIP